MIHITENFQIYVNEQRVYVLPGLMVVEGPIVDDRNSEKMKKLRSF